MTDGNALALTRAFLSMKDSGEMRAFMRDLLTESEIVEFSKRFYAARAIAGSTHYAAIEEATGLSSRTIARVKKWFKHGTGGYRLAIKRWKHQI
ncbi:MAG: TrpR protein [Parcubacteria group bacterium GW2011_GWA2_47_64]|nr:MAG: TrpR protein [Parcubacteria group bacterium GW2011_GWA2_47_64]KKU96295.1 MAG: TrpR protein [Parcubacteria group bacterium GW2011_GWC2_48_17]